MVSVNTIARKAAEDLGLPGPDSGAPAEEQKSEKKVIKEEAEQVNINLSVNIIGVRRKKFLHHIFSTLNVVTIIDSININYHIRWRMMRRPLRQRC